MKDFTGIDLPSASTNTQNVEDNGSQGHVVAATATATATPAATATRGVSNVPARHDMATPSPTQRPLKGHGRFQASKGHKGGTSMVDDDPDRRRPIAATIAAAREATKGTGSPLPNQRLLNGHGRLQA